MPPGHAPSPGPSRAVLAAPALGRHLTIRTWWHGDRVQPLGTAGRKKVQDVFVDRKVPRHERSQVPLVIDAQGRIAWVAGHVIGEAFRVSASTDAVVVLTLRR
ncbi:MAG: tRNA lysidine(34) synthetase TilS [Acidobacteria bacterium]|nr:tRNA lysidine(34) synthetase TilS [Acidobacteriota bacterium]